MAAVLPHSMRAVHAPASRPRCTRFGLEVSGGLTYNRWEPGGEYTKALLLKNVQLKTQKIKYRISGSQFSSAFYPQHIVLSAGTSCSLPITFRPSEKSPCEERVEFETAEGQVFAVPITAHLPRAHFSLPDCLEFGLCAVQHSVSNNFEISNTGNVSAVFSWEAPEGFAISPASGSLAPKETCSLVATFTPLSASVYNATAVCCFTLGSTPTASDTLSNSSASDENRSTRRMRLSGSGKYPYVVVKPLSRKNKIAKKGFKSEGNQVEMGAAAVTEHCSGGEVVVDFGSVGVGSEAERFIEISNISPVSASFVVEPVSLQVSNLLVPFSCPSPAGTVPPQGSSQLRLVYSPAVLMPHPSLGCFSVSTSAGLGGTTVKCVGRAKGPCVLLEESVLCFGNVACGRSSTAVLHLRNQSDVDTHFQLQLGPCSVFQATPLSARLAGGCSVKVSVSFTPLAPLPHSRRVACLVHNQEPLFVHLLGTSYSETVRPFVLQPGHVTSAHHALTTLPPQLVKQHLEEGRLRVKPGGDGLEPSPDHPLPDPAPCPSPYSQYLHSELDPFGVAHVSCDVDALQFDYCPPSSSSQEKLVSVTNHTRGTVCCAWMTGAADCFSVSPGEREVPAGSTAAFAVRFTPREPSKFYCKELECFVFYKALQDYRAVDPLTVLGAPWCLSLTVSGHSFHQQPFLPRVSFSSGASVLFPAGLPKRPVYQTTVIHNTGDTPALFSFSQDPAGVFTVKPAHGLIQPGHQLLVLELCPPEARPYTHALTCTLNATPANTQVLHLLGSGEAPSISLGNKGQLFFKPTCVGATSTAQLAVTNTSRLPARFEWRLADGASTGAAVSVEPVSGTILPAETQHHCWRFTPGEARQYSLKAMLHSSPPPHPPHSPPPTHTLRCREVLSVFGLATFGHIQCTPSHVDCGTVVIGSAQCHALTLSNPSLCDLHYQLSVEQQQQDSSNDKAAERGSGVVKLSPVCGLLGARSQTQVRVAVRPLSREPLTATISYQLTPGSAPSGGAGLQLCRLAVRGAYPAVRVADVQGVGAACMLSKAALWSMLSIERINGYLCLEPASSELRYAVATRHSLRRRVPVRTSATAGFDFGAATLSSSGGASELQLRLENRGEVPADWAFQFPVDMHLEPEYWAESGRLDDVERHELNVLTNQLFSVLPKTGRLEPGHSTTVLCSYRHTHVGTSRLPVLLKINRGREILLNWSGVTVEPGRPYIHFSSQQHCFQPVPIGAHAHPRQYYELLNAGDVSVSYELDPSPLEVLCRDNYSMPILQCLQPRGEVPARQSTAVPFVFSPLEAKKYSVVLPVHFSSGHSVLLTFSGEGYSPHSPDQPSPQTSSSSSSPSNPAVQQQQQGSGGIARLSQESLAFGALPLFAVKRAVVFVSNSSGHTLSFNWETGTGRASEVVSVQPVRGYIQPGQSAACKVTFCSHSSPSCYSLDLLCRVQDESELLRYHDDLQEWRRREEEEQHTFTITQAPSTATQPHTFTQAPPTSTQPHTLTQAPPTSTQPHTLTQAPPTATQPSQRPKSMPKLKSVAPIGGKSRPLSSDSQLRAKYPPLPPIGGSSLEESYEEWKTKDLSTKSKSRPRVRKTIERKVPSLPEPEILHLGVTATTHSLPDYASLYDDLYSFHIDRQTLVSQCQALPGADRQTLVSQCQALPGADRQTLVSGGLSVLTREKELLESVLNQMMRELLEDSDFQSAVQRVVEEPVPYFSQFSADPRAASEQAHRAAEQSPDSSPLPPSHPSLHHTSPPSQDTGDTASGGEQTADDSLASTHEAATLAQTEEELDTTIKHSPEFESLVEAVLENTLLNVLKEASAGELRLTAPIYTIAKPLPAQPTS